jgi:hypothetical protein
MLPSHLRLGLPSGLFPSGLLPSSMRDTCPAHLIVFDLIALIYPVKIDA